MLQRILFLSLLLNLALQDVLSFISINSRSSSHADLKMHFEEAGTGNLEGGIPPGLYLATNRFRCRPGVMPKFEKRYLEPFYAMFPL